MKTQHLLILSFLLSGCQLGLGAGLRPTTYDNKRITNMSNPVGIIRAEQKVAKNIKLTYEHLSSIPDNKEDYGINTFGLIYTFDVK